MIVVHQVLSAALQAQIIEHMETHIRPVMYVHPAPSAAAGRHEMWIPYKAPLFAHAEWEVGALDLRLWTWIQNTISHFGFTPEVGLITRGHGIRPHRDAGYAGYMGFGINFGVATFHIQEQYPIGGHGKYAIGQTRYYNLTGGEIFSFNPKNLHWATDVSEDRWSINLWDVRPKERVRYEAIKANNPLEEVE